MKKASFYHWVVTRNRNTVSVPYPFSPQPYIGTTKWTYTYIALSRNTPRAGCYFQCCFLKNNFYHVTKKWRRERIGTSKEHCQLKPRGKEKVGICGILSDSTVSLQRGESLSSLSPTVLTFLVYGQSLLELKDIYLLQSMVLVHKWMFSCCF